MAPMPDDAPVIRAIPLGVLMGSTPSDAARNWASARRNRLVPLSLKCHINVVLGHRETAMRDIAFLVYPGYSLMALAIVAGFEVVNAMSQDPPYDLHFVSEK